MEMTLPQQYHQLVILFHTWYKTFYHNIKNYQMSGCYCEFDPGQLIISEPYECACCEPDASQCGYPMHNYCKFDSDHPDEGCEGKKLEYHL